MFDIREELQKFKAINLEALEESIPNLSDDVKSSILLFNKAIDSIGRGSEDIAIIELKKATSINPGFHEALNLLGLCYAYSGEREKAAKTFERVIELERNGIQAYSYRKYLGGEMPESLQSIISDADTPAEKVKRIPVKKEVVIKPKAQVTRRSLVRFSIGFLLGMLLMLIAAYMYFLLSEPLPIEQGGEIISLKHDNAQLQSELDDLMDKYSELESAKKSIEDELREANSQLEYLEVVKKMAEAALYDEAGSYEKAADLLLGIDGDGLQYIEKTWLKLLKQRILPKAAAAAYDEGVRLCHELTDYEKGLEKLEKVFFYQENFEKMEALFYYTAKCYQGLGKYNMAMQLYNRILKEYPEGYYSGYAAHRIAEINSAAGNR